MIGIKIMKWYINKVPLMWYFYRILFLFYYSTISFFLKKLLGYMTLIYYDIF
jgi:hypothetical protein